MTAPSDNSNWPDSVPTQLLLDATGHLHQDLACHGCGYNLRGLSPDSVCPECAAAIGRSIYGDLIQFSDPVWVEKLARGANVIVVCLLCSIIGGIIVSMVSESAAAYFSAAVGLIILRGYWLITSSEPGKSDEECGITARRLIRIGVSIHYVTSVVAALPPLAEPVRMFVVLISTVMGMVGSIALFVYARRLALRFPDERLAKHTNIVMWGMIGITSLTLLALLITTMGGVAQRG